MLKMIVIVVSLTLFAFASRSERQGSPYAGQEQREIKSLSAEEIDAYLSGAGMGLARAAELNGYPGPRHVLELVEELNLTEEQRETTEAIFSEMKADAIGLGKEIVALERRLDTLFAEARITPSTLSNLTEDIASAKGKLRLVHLRAHLRQRAVLDEEQTARYTALRGYEPHTEHKYHH